MRATELKMDGPSTFEQAADAMVAGDAVTLASLLRRDPHLVQARSERAHRATLLHYVGANGVEDERQKSPKNAVAIAKTLLDAGSAVDAVADMYGGSTTLDLVATSIHPKQAGVQIPLMETLLERGAALNEALVIAALRNGRAEAAEFLAQRGAALNLEGAAGVGRLDVVKTFFHEDGALAAGTTKAQLEDGFLWACEYGHNEVADFLLNKGAALGTQGNTGQTGLHWAVVGGQVETIRLLLDRGAPLEARNRYGGTVLGQALWSAINGDPSTDYVRILELLLDAGAKVEEDLLEWVAHQGARSSAENAWILELLRSHSLN